MTNEEKILARLDELTIEVREAKKAAQSCLELKESIEPLINDTVRTALQSLEEHDRRFDPEEVGDMLQQLLISSKNITEAVKMLDRMMEFKEDFEPYSKAMFKELTEKLQTSLQGFEPENLQELIRQCIANMGNIAESLKMLGSVMDLKNDANTLSKEAFNDVVERLENLKRRGVFDAFENVFHMTERLGTKMQTVDFDNARPVRGVFGMYSAMKRPEVQEGMGVLIELSTVMTALKEERP
jgi:uncharacterized protein YjgD (DUF1641 family)